MAAKGVVRARRGTAAAVAAGAVLAATLGGCGFQKPTIKLRDIEVVGLDFDKVDLRLDLAVTNPNDFQISLHGLDYHLTAAGEQFAAGTLPRPVAPVAAKQTTLVKAPVAVGFAGLREVLTRTAGADDIDYELAVTATFNVLGIKLPVPLTRRGRLPAMRAPSWRFRNVKWLPEERTLALSFEVDNPNRFALPLQALSGALVAGDKTLLRVDRSSLAPVPAGGTSTVTVPVKVTGVEAAAAVAKALADPKALRFEGNLDLSAPVSLHEMLVQGLKDNE